jgi:TetR/AcrR family transcriptional regulator, cholesterol catabolism regulator
MSSGSGIGRRRALARQEGSSAYVEKRAQMVRAAAHIFKEKGYEATTLSDIADAVGADRATIYYYVASKEELLHEAVGDTTKENLELLSDLVASKISTPERVRLFIEGMLAGYEKHYPEVFVYIQEDMTKVSRREGAWAQKMAAQIREFEDGLVALLQAGVEDGSFRKDLDVKLLSEALWGMINWTHRWHKPGGPVTAKEIADNFAAVFLEGVVPRN